LLINSVNTCCFTIISSRDHLLLSFISARLGNSAHAQVTEDLREENKHIEHGITSDVKTLGASRVLESTHKYDDHSNNLKKGQNDLDNFKGLASQKIMFHDSQIDNKLVRQSQNHDDSSGCIDEASVENRDREAEVS